METDIQLTNESIPEYLEPVTTAAVGAWVEFRGLVRGEEAGRAIAALEYEAYAPMALSEIRRVIHELAERHPCLGVRVIHRLGVVPVGEAAIYVGVASRHRAEAFAFLAGFMDDLKKDVPIWKRRSLTTLEMEPLKPR
jgi:molybdopterin synthase catalytic subunit